MKLTQEEKQEGRKGRSQETETEMEEERAEGEGMTSGASRLQEVGQRVKGAAAETMEDLKDQASEYYGRGRERVQAMEKDLESAVSEHPIRSLLMGIGAGFILGRLLRMR